MLFSEEWMIRNIKGEASQILWDVTTWTDIVVELGVHHWNNGQWNADAWLSTANTSRELDVAIKDVVVGDEAGMASWGH